MSNNASVENSGQMKVATTVEEGVRCLYPSKHCDKHRVTKRNGELHKFCEFHRCKANLNQRRLEFRRKAQQDQQQEDASRRPPGNQISSAQIEQWISESVMPLPGEFSADLTEEEIQILREFLYSSSDDEAAMGE